MRCLYIKSISFAISFQILRKFYFFPNKEYILKISYFEKIIFKNTEKKGFTGVFMYFPVRQHKKRETERDHSSSSLSQMTINSQGPESRPEPEAWSPILDPHRSGRTVCCCLLK